MRKSILFHLRTFNYLILATTITLTIWMSFGSDVLKPACNLKIFESRKASCLRNGTLEIRDRLSILVLLLIVCTFLLLAAGQKYQLRVEKHNRINQITDFAAICIVLALISSRSFYPSLEQWRLEPNLEFSGMGSSVTFLVAIFSILLSLIFFSKKLLERIKFFFCKNQVVLNGMLLSFWALFYFPALVQPSTGLSSKSDSIYVYNDIIGPTVGYFPLSDFAPHYNAMFGWAVYFTSKFLGVRSTFIVIPTLLSILNICVLLLLARLFKKIYPKVPFIISLTLLSSFLVARSSDSSSAFTSQSFPSWVSRFFLPICATLLLHASLDRKNRLKSHYWFTFLGFTSVLALINNLEFGLTTFLSMTLVIFVLATLKLISRLNFVYYLVGSLLALLSLWIAYSLSGKTLKPIFYVLIPKAFSANGFGSFPIPKFGFYVLIYTVIAFALFASTRILVFAPKSDSSENFKDHLSEIAVFTFGATWSIQSLLYYSGRSVDGSLRLLFVPVFLAIMPLFKLFFGIPNKLIINARNSLTWLPALMTCLLPVAMLIKAPYPEPNWGRLLNSTPTWSWETTKSRPIAREYLKLSSESRTVTGILAIDGYSVELVTGARNLLTVPNFEILSLSSKVQENICDSILDADIEVVIAEISFLTYMDNLCPNFLKRTQLNNDKFVQFERFKP